MAATSMAKIGSDSKDMTQRHFIAEWAERRGLRQADIVNAIGVDKGTVSRWFGGQVPRDQHLLALAGFFSLDDPLSLFRHPDDDWIARFLKDRSAEDLARIKATLEAAFPHLKAS